MTTTEYQVQTITAFTIIVHLSNNYESSFAFQGYLKQAKLRPQMFSEEQVGTIFGNINEIYAFSNTFQERLGECINSAEPHRSEIGQCFLDYVSNDGAVIESYDCCQGLLN